MAATEERLSVCERLLIVWRYLLHSRRKWVVVEHHCVPGLCCTIGIVCGLPVVGQNFLEMGVLEE